MLQRNLVVAMVAMTLVVVASNYLVQFPLNDWLTWGAFTYPLSFLITDLTNRAHGPSVARRVVLVGFLAALVMSYLVVSAEHWRIPLASVSAFLIGQLCDVTLFNRLRRQSWWRAPLFASVLASVVDTLVFFAGAFAATGLDWTLLALGDLAVKLAMALLLLVPFRLLMAVYRPLPVTA